MFGGWNLSATSQQPEPTNYSVSQPLGEAAGKLSVRREVKNDLLGNTASIASSVYPSQIPSAAIEAKKRRYRLQTVARKLLPDERIRTCHRDTIPAKLHVDIVANPEFSSASFRNLQTCNSVWSCPVCAAKISEQRREELSTALVSSSFRSILVTYTLRHRTTNPLVQSLTALKEARRSLKSGEWFQNLKDDYGWAGSVTSHEVTYSDRNGWHPHAHELVLLPKDITDNDLEGITLKLRRRWLEVLAREGYTAEYDFGVDVQTSEQWVEEYVAKWGHEPQGRQWTPAHEVTKAVSKSARADGLTPWQLLELCDSGDMRAGELFQEYFYAFKGSHQLQWAPGTRKALHLGEDAPTDEVLAAADEPGEPLAVLAYEQWKYILVGDRRGELLEVAAKNDYGLLMAYFEVIGMPRAVIKIDFTGWNTESAKLPPLPDKPALPHDTLQQKLL